jgi:hypothetical protein
MGHIENRYEISLKTAECLVVLAGVFHRRRIAMGFLSRLLGTENKTSRHPESGTRAAVAPNGDEQALERYRYMLRTAPPETLEQAHAEAFQQLTPQQRQQVLSGLTSAAPPSERAAVAATRTDDAQALARVATRAEVREPGTLERSLGGAGMGLGTSLLGSLAMGFVGSMVAQSFFSALGGFGEGAVAEAPADADADEPVYDDAGDQDGDFGDDFDA